MQEKLENTMKDDEPRGKRSSKSSIANSNNSNGGRARSLFGDEGESASDHKHPVHSTSYPRLCKHSMILSTSASQEFVRNKSNIRRRANRWPILNAALRLRKLQPRPTLVQGVTPSRRVDLRNCGRLLEDEEDVEMEVRDLPENEEEKS